MLYLRTGGLLYRRYHHLLLLEIGGEAGRGRRPESCFVKCRLLVYPWLFASGGGLGLGSGSRTGIWIWDLDWDLSWKGAFKREREGGGEGREIMRYIELN